MRTVLPKGVCSGVYSVEHVDYKVISMYVEGEPTTNLKILQLFI